MLAERKVLELAELRYKGGVAAYLEALDAQRSLFDAELDQAHTIGTHLVSLVRLYKALGGGWPSAPEPEASPAPSTETSTPPALTQAFHARAAAFRAPARERDRCTSSGGACDASAATRARPYPGPARRGSPGAAASAPRRLSVAWPWRAARTGVAGLRVPPSVRAVLLATAVAAILVRWWPTRSAPALALSTLVSLGLMAIVVVVQAFRSALVNVHRIQGAVAAYLLFGLTWAAAYQLVDALAPGSFAGAPTAAPDSRLWIYFSFVTLTTVGYGDVTPVHPAARSLALLEALTGQLYPAILLARLVSLQAARREES